MPAATRLPISTYRLQFNRQFTFADARAIVDYLRQLGIGDCYASSYLAAVPGSPHGYDVADPSRLNDDLGTEHDYWQWIESLRAHGMGHVLDLVPNHMGIALSANPWWLDVLENGPSSRFARVFDIEWHPVKDELADKVLIPILGDQYGAVLERRELTLTFEDGAFRAHYYDEVLPIAPDTYGVLLQHDLTEWLAAHPGDDADELQSIVTAANHLPPRSTRDRDAIAVRAREKEVVKRRLAALADRSVPVRDHIAAAMAFFNGTAGQPRSFDALDGLLNLQSYRLAHWRVASEEINYRRFFDVNQLAAVRMEDPAVFDDVHRFVLDLIRRGGPTGLRVDHVDGLFAPADYLRRLQSSIADDGPFYIVVEKILGPGEAMPEGWPVAGTTGYEFGSVVNNLFVDRRNERALDEIYQRFARPRTSFGDLAYGSKKTVLHETMSGDINSLGHQLNRFSERNRHFRDFTLYSLISTLKDVIACFPVYRTYITEAEPVSAHDARCVHDAMRCAKRRAPALSRMVIDFIERLLLKQTTITSEDEGAERARFIGKFQQITSPVAAKGIEDTALYVYNRLLSLNEVGSDPTVFGLEPDAVHAWMAARQRTWPGALSATSTHDTKRGEDVRARLNVLSELPGAWRPAVAKWRAMNRRFKRDLHGLPVPDANEEYFLYQTMVGMWPFGSPFEVDITAIRDRLTAYMTKAVRESKTYSSWLSPDEEHEQAVVDFVGAILDRRRSAAFLQSFDELRARVAELGIYNSLAQLLIKITAPGVPDFYQGTELWDLNLVDPDNRRPVDYQARRDALAAIDRLKSCATPDECIADLLQHRRDGRLKMFVTARSLAARAERRRLYEQGDYLPLTTSGSRRDCLFAFARRFEGESAITCVPRLIGTLVPDASGPPLGAAAWADTAVALPEGVSSRTGWRDVFSGARIDRPPAGGSTAIAAARLFERFPIALLVPCST